MSTKRVNLIINGRVQGVCFRAFAEQLARSYKLTGWVRNKPDQNVEIVAEGEDAVMRLFIKQIKQGPPLARVVRVVEKWEEATGEFHNFDIMYWRSRY